MLGQLKRRMVVLVKWLTCSIGAAGLESVWKAESDNTANIFIVLGECPGIPSVRYPVADLLKSVLFRPFFQCERPYLKEKELT